MNVPTHPWEEHQEKEGQGKGLCCDWACQWASWKAASDGVTSCFSGEQCRISASAYEHMSSLLPVVGLFVYSVLQMQRYKLFNLWSTGREHWKERSSPNTKKRSVLYVTSGLSVLLLEFSKWGKINHAGVMPCRETSGYLCSFGCQLAVEFLSNYFASLSISFHTHKISIGV